MHGPGADDGCDDNPDEDAGHPVSLVAALFESVLKVAIGKPKGEGQADAVGMNL